MLKTLKTIPPGGWIFEQKTPAGTIKKFSTMVPFGEAVKGIVAYRKGNAIEPHDFESVAVELENQTCARLGHNPKYCEVKKKSLLDKINILPAHVKKAVELAGNATNGARILSDWLGDGAIPVNRSLAQARTNVCISCPLNQESHGMMKLTDAIASAILEQRRQKTEMSLEVISETELHTCSVCACHLPLKVWVPMKTIANRTHPKLVEKFPDFCWMKTENNEPKEDRETQGHDKTVEEPECDTGSVEGSGGFGLVGLNPEPDGANGVAQHNSPKPESNSDARTFDDREQGVLKGKGGSPLPGNSVVHPGLVSGMSGQRGASSRGENQQGVQSPGIKEGQCKDGTVPTARQQSHETSEATLPSASSASARDSTIPPVASPSFGLSEPQASPSLKSPDSPNLKSKKKTETSIPSTTV